MCDKVLLHVRCGGCAKLYQRSVDVPEGDDVPTDGEDLVQSEFVRSLKFICPKCEAPFAQIVAFKILEEARAA